VTTSSLGPDSRVRVAPSVYARAFGAELVLLEFRQGEYFGLDPIGATIWKNLEAGKTLREVARAITEQYQVGEDEALKDVVELVESMHHHALVATE
jgi:hypothetical protein